MGNVINLSPHPSMDVDDAIEYLYRNKDDYEEVLVLGYCEDGSISVISSQISNREALWMLEHAKIQVLKGQ